MNSIDVNLSGIRKLYYSIDPLIPYEINLIKYYTNKPTLANNPIAKITNDILNDKYHTKDISYPYDKIYLFYGMKKYTHAVMYFLRILEIYIRRYLPANIDRIEYDSIVNMTKDSFIVRFKVR